MKIKSGFKTTEFWLALVGVSTILYDFYQKHCVVGQADVYALAGIIIVYIANRAWIKRNNK